MNDQNTDVMFDVPLVRINTAWAFSVLTFMLRKHKREATGVVNLLVAARTVDTKYVYDVYQYVSPIFDKLVKVVRLEESCRYSSAYQKKLEDALVAVWAAVDSLENEAGQVTLNRLIAVCSVR